MLTLRHIALALLAIATGASACVQTELVPRDGFDAIPEVADGDADDGSGDEDVAEADTEDSGDEDTSVADTVDDTGTGDTADDTGTDDTGADDAGDADDTADGSGDSGDWAPRWTNTPTTNPKVQATSDLSYDALVAYCSCCADEEDGGRAACFAEEFNGGMRVDECRAGVFDSLGTSADGWLDCMGTAWFGLAGCNACAEGGCSLCATNFAVAAQNCATSNPATQGALGACEE